MQYPILDRLMQMQYLYLIGCSCILDWILFVAGANANAISILDRLQLYTRLDLICGRG